MRVGAQFCGSAVVRDAIQPCRTVRYLADSLNEQRSQREPAAASATFSAPTGANPLDDLRLAVVRALAAAPVILVVDGALGSDAVRLCELVRACVRARMRACVRARCLTDETFRGRRPVCPYGKQWLHV